MNIKKGKIRNINKKLIAGALVFTLVAVPLTGCETKTYENFKYSINDQGQYVASGKIEYNLLKTHCFLVIENSTYNVTEFYIANKINQNCSPSSTVYIDIFSDQIIFDPGTKNDNRQMLVCDKIEDYLCATNNIKASYTVEEVKLIFEQLKENYLKQNNKELVKE